MPLGAPAVNRAECAVTGAELRFVDGLISDAGRLVSRAVAADETLFDVSTLKEPYRIEGKKTIGLEIAEQLGWSLPDVILCPTGGGVGLIAIYKALLELRELGWIDGALPRLVAVQAAGCAPIAAAFAAARQLARDGWLSADESVVALNTGTGLKYPDTVVTPVTAAAPLR